MEGLYASVIGDHMATASGYSVRQPGFINPATVVPFTRATLAEANFFQRELVKMTSALGHRSMSGHDADHLPVVSDGIYRRKF